MRIALLIVLFSVNYVTLCQKYPGTASDTVKLNAYLDSVYNSPKPTYTDVKDIIYRAKKLVRKSDNKFYAAVLIQEGYLFYEKAEYAQAANIWDSAGYIYKRLNAYHNYINCLNKAGLCYVYNSNYKKASECLFTGLALADKYNESFYKANLCTNISILYQSLDDWDNAIHFALQSIPLDQALKDTNGWAISENNIGNLYLNQKLADSAISHFKKSYQLHKVRNKNSLLATTLLNIGASFIEKNRPDSAVVYLKQAELLNKKGTDMSINANVNSFLLQAYTKLGNKKIAGTYLNKALGNEHTIEDLDVKTNLYSAVVSYYKLIGDSKRALLYNDRLNAVRDTLQAESKNLEYQKAALKYELNKKVFADSLQAEQKVIVANNKTIKTENSLLIVAILLLIVLFVAFVLFSRAKQLKRKHIITLQEKQIAEQLQNTYQLQALQAQMNPHFVFNCFSTIDAYILQNKQPEASRLVQRFSKLSRHILEQTSLSYIAMAAELETLETYLQIEQMRSSDSFDFYINCKESLLTCLIPPMLLQPFVENAVIHGIRHLKDRKGTIQITVDDENGLLKISIEDNGIGREKAALIKQESSRVHNSIGMELTLNRLRALHKDDTKRYLEIIDLNNGQAGTMVCIKMPQKIADAECCNNR